MINVIYLSSNTPTAQLAEHYREAISKRIRR